MFKKFLDVCVSFMGGCYVSDNAIGIGWDDTTSGGEVGQCSCVFL